MRTRMMRRDTIRGHSARRYERLLSRTFGLALSESRRRQLLLLFLVRGWLMDYEGWDVEVGVFGAGAVESQDCYED